MSAPQFVVTVDVEDFFEPRPPFDTYRAEIGNRAYGTPLIMDLLERHGGRGTFFVDVYNRRTVTEQIIAETMREIDTRGHEVGLHTHPAFPEGRRGYGMAQTMRTLDLVAQTDFIREGIELIDRWIGKRPVSHRAGGYGADYNTLRALAANGISIDSSLFFGYPYCKLNDPPLSANAPVCAEGVLEIPVTVTRCDLMLGPFKKAPRILSLIKKLDPDWCSPGELRRQIKALINAGTNPIILFLHSYSLIDIEKDFRPDHRAINTLDQILADLREHFGGELVTLERAARQITETHSNSLTLPPVVPSDILLRDRELTWWLLRKVRLRHLGLVWSSRISRVGQGRATAQSS